MHTTEFEWPKSMQPSGFAMKVAEVILAERHTLALERSYSLRVSPY